MLFQQLKTAILYFSTSACFMLTAPHLSAEQTQKPLVLCFNNYPPYSIGNESLSTEPTGIKVDIARYIFHELDVDIKIITLPFKQCLKKVRTGELDGALPLSKNQDRAQYMVFSNEANPQSYVYIFKKSRFPDGINWTTYDDIKHLKLVLNLGTFIDTEMQAIFSSVRPIQRSLNLETLVLMVEENRADLGAMDLDVARYLFDEMGFTESLTISTQVINNEPVHFGFSKKSPIVELLPKINSILQRMNSDGTMANIMKKKYRAVPSGRRLE